VEAPGGVEPPTRSLGILGSDAVLREISYLEWCPILQSDVMLRH